MSTDRILIGILSVFGVGANDLFSSKGFLIDLPGVIQAAEQVRDAWRKFKSMSDDTTNMVDSELSTRLDPPSEPGPPVDSSSEVEPPENT
jgi:hypothetical protein